MPPYYHRPHLSLQLDVCTSSKDGFSNPPLHSKPHRSAPALPTAQAAGKASASLQSPDKSTQKLKDENKLSGVNVVDLPSSKPPLTTERHPLTDKMLVDQLASGSTPTAKGNQIHNEADISNDQPRFQFAPGSGESDTMAPMSDSRGKPFVHLKKPAPHSTEGKRYARKKPKRFSGRLSSEFSRKHKGGTFVPFGQFEISNIGSTCEGGLQPNSKKGVSTDMEVDNLKRSGRKEVENKKRDGNDLGNHDFEESDEMEQFDDQPGSSGEEADIDTCSAGSGTGESVLRRAHRLRAAVVCKDGHVPPQGQQHEGDCMVASRLLQLWTAVPIIQHRKVVRDQGSVTTPHHGQVAIPC